MKISVIVPVYNTETYLCQCIESIINQTYRDIEVVLVDDGSTDTSGEICDNYALSDHRIKVVHKENGGLSDARNCGMNIATGDYIIFIDSDDYWAAHDSLETLVAEAKISPECDFIGFNCSYLYQSTNKLKRWRPYSKAVEESIAPSECIKHLVASGVFPMSACFKLIKRSIITDNLYFTPNTTAEDIPWFINLLENTHKCRFINLYMYVYRKDVPTSISSSFSLKKFNDLFVILAAEINKKRSWSVEAQDAILSFFAFELCILRAMTGYMTKAEREEALTKLYDYNWLLRYQTNPKVRCVARIEKFVGRRAVNTMLYIYLKYRMS